MLENTEEGWGVGDVNSNHVLKFFACLEKALGIHLEKRVKDFGLGIICLNLFLAQDILHS